ncbi:MAG: pentapeptide repeat family protein, partial [Phenylobacterium sp.]|nr:pentapeptide repeat family protein [Phenylobacterium sp.]
MAMPHAPAHSLVVRRLNQAEVEAICAKHDRLWSSKPGGARAVFAWCDLTGLD